MRRSSNFAAGLVLTLAAACGSPSQTRQMQIGFADKALSAQADRVAIYFYIAGDCNAARGAVPRAASSAGPFTVTLDADRRGSGLRFTEIIPVGTYVVLADALDADSTLVGTGCAEGQQVREGETSVIQITISG